MNPEKEEQIRQDAIYDTYFSSEFDRVRNWFLSNFEDPAENTPYDSSEGGYMYLWGGPYDAAEEIYDKFSGDVEESILNAVIESLEGLGTEWAKVPSIGDFDDFAGIPSQIERFRLSIQNINSELDRVKDLPNRDFVQSLLFAHSITILETYLQDTFVQFIQEDVYKRKFVENDPVFKKEKIQLADLYRKLESIDSVVAERILSIVFHRSDVVEKMFGETLGISFPDGKGRVFRYISKRHDVIHRNCRDCDGNEFIITKSEIVEAIDCISKIVESVEEQATKLRSNQSLVSIPLRAPHSTP